MMRWCNIHFLRLRDQGTACQCSQLLERSRTKALVVKLQLKRVGNKSKTKSRGHSLTLTTLQSVIITQMMAGKIES